MKPNTTSENNQDINTTTKALINPKCLQIYSNNHAFSALIMDQDPLSPEVRVFMIEEEALWYEFRHVDSQQGSSSEGNLWADMPSARALSQARAGPSG